MSSIKRPQSYRFDSAKEGTDLISSEENSSTSDQTAEPTAFDVLLDAAKKGLADEIDKYLKEEKYRNVVNETDTNEKYTPLMWAAMEGHVDTVQVFCKYLSKEDIDKDEGWVCLKSNSFLE